MPETKISFQIFWPDSYVIGGKSNEINEEKQGNAVSTELLAAKDTHLLNH
jgi:hypothetical protein